MLRCIYWLPIRTTKSHRTFTSTVSRAADFTHAVIGAGAVGLAIARRLAARSGSSTLIIERNGDVGTETSSRNSEVIHAGLYYGENSLKTKLCIRGKHMLYELCSKNNIPHKRIGKWIVGQDEKDLEQLEKIHAVSKKIDGIPTTFVSAEEAGRQEPDVQAAWVLESPSTGIIDSHAYMQYLQGSLEERGGDIVVNTTVNSITPLCQDGGSGWEIQTQDKSTGDENVITADTIINSAGLSACHISNMILPPSRHCTPYYAKGNYFSYSASSPKTRRLIYPAPSPGLGGLGTHLTLDLSGRIRFGPDVEWVDEPTDLSIDASRLPQALEEICKYLPSVRKDDVQPDYAGIRPKLEGRGGGFVDFVIQREEGFQGFVNLLGIESPGLTASLAVAEMVEGLLYR